MSHTKLYAWIYVILFVFATVQVAVEYTMLEGSYWIALGLIMVLSGVKAVMVAGYYQHLRWEPRSVTYLVVGALLVVLALTGAASFSIL